MKKPTLAQVIVFTLLFWLFGPQAVAQTAPPVPPVFPAQAGSTVGSSFRAGNTPEGKWVAWRYTINGATHTYVGCATHDYQPIYPNTTGFTPIRTLRAYWEANVTFDCTEHPTLFTLVPTALLAFNE